MNQAIKLYTALVEKTHPSLAQRWAYSKVLAEFFGIDEKELWQKVSPVNERTGIWK